MTVYPNYYERFRCIADRCRHNCCIGWEIDVDEETAHRYLAETGEFGDRLKAHVRYEDETYSFRLSEDERCPFLGADNLCDIIKTMGEGALCEICRLHPRYRNFYTEREEIGLGLACEEAARLILSSTDRTVLTTSDKNLPSNEGDEEEKELFRLREDVFSCLQDRTCSFANRADRLVEVFHLPVARYSWEEWIRIFSELECLDPSWRTCLAEVTAEEWNQFDSEMEIPAEQLAFTFVYRHLPKVLDGYSVPAVLSFCLVSVRLIAALWQAGIRRHGNLTLEEMAESARMYSAEIEYSTDNTEAILDLLEE